MTAAAWLLVLVSACSAPKRPDFNTLYSRAAQMRDDLRNPVIVIPGILGSRLETAEGGVVWGAFDKTTVRPTTPAGSRAIALPLIGAAAETGATVSATGVLDRVNVRLLGIPLRLQAYANILRALGVDGGYRDSAIQLDDVDYGTEHFTCFQFPYDWRRDIAESAAELDRFIREQKAFVEAELLRRYGVEQDVKFDLVAHSMGGLVARYYLRYGAQPLPEDGSLPELDWAGAEFVDKAILVGTPNHGSPDALDRLTEGFKPGPLIPRYPAALLGTMPAAYQLLPRARHLAIIDRDNPREPFEDLFDVKLWEELGWGLLDPEQDEVLSWLLPQTTSREERQALAKEHVSTMLGRARQFAAALDRRTPRPEGLELYAVVGDAEPTTAAVAIDRGSGRRDVIRTAPGDGTVLRSSALGDERVGGPWERRLPSPTDWSHVTFVFSDHVGLTRDPMFIDNLLFLLLEQ
ncbi:MAG: hypothetical protein AAF690_29315 [Acidobacteriota bacterium]